MLLRNETLNMNTTETINATEGPQPVHQPVKPIKFPNQPHEWKIISLRECPTPDEMQLCDEPDRAAAYWRTHVTADKHFNPDCECFVVLMLNTRRRIRGHYLVSIGTMDTILVHPREVFRLAIAANAHSLVLMHNHLPKHGCVLVHCEKGFKRTVLPPMEPEEKISPWFKKRWL